MNRFTFTFIMLIAIYPFINGCSYSSIDAAEEGVLTYQPWIFGHGGVERQAVSTGAIWTAWSTRVDRFPIVPIKLTESFVDLASSDNVMIDFDTYLTLKIKKGETPKLREFSGINWYDNKVKDQYRMIVRNEARTRTSNDLRTNQDVILSIQKNIKTLISQYIKSIDLPIDVIKVNVSKVIPPNEVLEESAKTAAQKQRKQTQDQRKLAEDARAAAEKATALADKAYSEVFKLTNAQFLKNKELDIMDRAVKEGKVTLIINASNAEPIFNVK